MIDNVILTQFRDRYNSLSVDGKGDNFSALGAGLTLGLVVNTDDPLEQGRLQVFCPALNDNPKKIAHLPWASYIMPFGGSINNPNYTRGSGKGKATSEGAIHYGFLGICELGAHVIVGCIDGDPRRRFWLGSIPEMQETHTLLTGRFDWDSRNGTPDGPLTSDKKPIQPIYDNLTEAFVDKTSREWKSRGADYQPMANSVDGNGSPSEVKGSQYLDDSYEGLSENEKDEWVKETLGAHGYDWSGFGSHYKSSRVFGYCTPGFHAFYMDDRPFNSRVKMRSGEGHMILLDDTNERIYLMTNKGKNWIEMDSNGNIDVYSERRVSINAAKDINLTSGSTIRLHAQDGIHMFAGHGEVGQRESLAYKPLPGEIRIQSETDFSVLANNIRNKSFENTYNEIGINLYNVVGDSMFTDVGNDINVRTIAGDYIQSIAKNLFETVQNDSKRYTVGRSALSSQGDTEIFAFEGGLSVGSNRDASFKSAGGNVDIEAMGQTTDAGSVRINSPRSQVNIGDDGISGLTSGSATFKAADHIELEISEDKTEGKTGGAKSAPLNIEGIPEVPDCSIGELPPVSYTPGQPLTMEQAAQIAYNAGWRGEDLTIAVALMSGESSYNPSAVNGSASDGKWGPAVGLFQIRTLNNPRQYAGTIDEYRDNTDGQLEDPNHNARVAFKIWEKCSPPGRWSVGKWETFSPDRVDTLFTPAVAAANDAVQALCSGMPLEASFEPINVTVTPEESYVHEGCDHEGCAHAHGVEQLMGLPSAASGTAFLMSSAKMTLQSAADIDFSALGAGKFNAYSNIVNTINMNVMQTNMLTYAVSILVDSVDDLAGAVGESFSVPFSFDIGALVGELYSIMPPELTALAGDLATLNSMISGMGGLGLDMPLDMMNIVSELEGNTAALAALGLPTDLVFPIDPSFLGALDILNELNYVVEALDIPFLELPTFRPLADRIFQNVAYPIGTVVLDAGDILDLGGGLF